MKWNQVRSLPDYHGDADGDDESCGVENLTTEEKWKVQYAMSARRICCWQVERCIAWASSSFSGIHLESLHCHCS